MPAKKKNTRRATKARKAPARNAKTARANPVKAASTKRARPSNGTLAIGGALKTRLSEMAKAGGHANWKQAALALIDNGIRGSTKA